MVTIVVSDQDSRFKYDVSERPGGENIKLCFSCGLCTGSCPVSEIDENYSPRKIIRQVLLGMRKEVLSSDVLWLCSLCYTCYSHCPQNVKFTDIMRALRVMAVEEGYVHPTFVNRIKQLDEFSQQLRHAMALALLKGKTEEAKADPADLLGKAVKEVSRIKKPAS